MAIPLLLLNPYVDAVLVIALGICIGGIMNALTPYIAKIPWVGGAIANAVSGMAQAITHACGVILRPISSAVGGTLHSVARLIDWSYAAFRRHSSLLLHLALTVEGIAFALHALRVIVHKAVGTVGAVLPRVKALEREWHGIEHRVKVLERKIAKGIGNDIRLHIKALEREVTGLREKVIPDLRSAVNAAEGDVSALRNWIGARVNVSYADWVAGLVAAGLAALGLGGLRCNSNPFKNNPNACGLWGDLSQLLGVLATVIAVEDFEQLVREMQQAEQGVATGLHDLLNL